MGFDMVITYFFQYTNDCTKKSVVSYSSYHFIFILKIILSIFIVHAYFFYGTLKNSAKPSPSHHQQFMDAMVTIPMVGNQGTIAADLENLEKSPRGSWRRESRPSLGSWTSRPWNREITGIPMRFRDTEITWRFLIRWFWAPPVNVGSIKLPMNSIVICKYHKP